MTQSLEKAGPSSPASDLAEPVEDLSFEMPAEGAAPQLAPYNPDRDRERVRGLIAGGLLALITVLTCGTVALVLAGRTIDEVAKLYAMVVTPIITLTSGVIGFYFGTQTRHD